MLIPVSYTHLDVYKRQEKIFNDLKYDFNVISEEKDSIGTVSYTHLDVYNRQVPISTNPKPKSANSLKSNAFLSKPAAKPTGFLNFNPNNSRSKRLFSIGFGKNNLVKNPNFFSMKKVK